MFMTQIVKERDKFSQVLKTQLLSSPTRILHDQFKHILKMTLNLPK